MAKQRERREATRAKITEAAAALMASRGFDAVSVDQIAASADVAKGTFYQHFETKLDVVLAIGREQMTGPAGEALRALERGRDPIAVVRRFLKETSVFFEENRHLAEAMVRHHVEKNAGRSLATEPGTTRHIIAEAMTRAKKRGMLKRGVEPLELGMLLSGVFAQAIVGWARLPDPPPLSVWVDKMLRIVFDGALRR